MSFCEHCQGQRFDRARSSARCVSCAGICESAHGGAKVDAALERALIAVKRMDIPHLETEDDYSDEVVH